NERGKRSGAPKSAAGHTAAEGAKRLQESVSGHPLRVAKSLTGQRPYMCCNGQAKDLVSARFRRPPWTGYRFESPARGDRRGVCRGLARSVGQYGFLRNQQASRSVAGNDL